MLQIRLSKGPSSDIGGGGPARSVPPVETVTVACPEHLVIADLPVAKSLGTFTASTVSSGRTMGRRSRRQLGDRIHLCVRCDFPIAIYGRLIPCEHAFCLACARSDPSCYLCDDRVQKIQTIKMLEGIFICAAPHCLKSFLKKGEFESHVHETHADLLQPNADKEGGGSETNNLNMTRPSSADLQKLSSFPETSTARAPPPMRSGFSPNSNSQPLDRDDRPHRLLSRDHMYPRHQLPQLRPPPQLFHSSQPHQPGDIQVESNTPQDHRPYNWYPPPPQRFDGNQFHQDTNQLPPPGLLHPESIFPNFGAQIPHHQPNYPLHVDPNRPLITAPFNFSAFPTDGSQPFFGATPQYEMSRPESAPSEGGAEQGSVLGIPPTPAGVGGYRENYPPRPWGMDLMGMPFQSIPSGQADSPGGMTFFQGDFRGMMMNNHLLQGKDSEQQQGGSGNNIDGKSMLSSLPGQMQSSLPLPPPPPLPPPFLQQLNRGRFSVSGDATREGRYVNWPD